MTRTSGKAPSPRQLKVGEEIKRILAEALSRGEVFSPLFPSSDVIVSEARVSPDFSVAKVFVATLGGGREQELLDFLAKVKGQLRKILGSKIKLRVTPDLTFIADKSFGEAARIEELLYRPEVKRDLQS